MVKDVHYFIGLPIIGREVYMMEPRRMTTREVG